MTAEPELATTLVGDGPHRIVFLHGLMGRGRNFTTIAKGLGDAYSCLLVDLPNHGASAWTDDFDYIAIADRVARHLRGRFAAHGPVAVVGHSMGGKVAMVLALRHPELVSRLVVVDIAPTDSSATGGEFPHLLGSLAAVDLAKVTERKDADEQLREPIPNSIVRGFLMQNLRRADGGYDWEPNLEMLLRELPDVAGFPDLGDVEYDGPTLWIGGSKSNYITDATVPVMRELFPRVRRVTIKDAGHWVHSEQPERFIATLRWFLEQVD